MQMFQMTRVPITKYYMKVPSYDVITEQAGAQQLTCAVLAAAWDGLHSSRWPYSQFSPWENEWLQQYKPRVRQGQCISPNMVMVQALSQIWSWPCSPVCITNIITLRLFQEIRLQRLQGSELQEPNIGLTMPYMHKACHYQERCANLQIRECIHETMPWCSIEDLRSIKGILHNRGGRYTGM